MTFAFEAPKKRHHRPRSGKKASNLRDQIDLSADKFALSVDRERNMACCSDEKCSCAHFSSLDKKEIHSGENRQEKLASAVGSIIKRPFIIQVIIKIVCVYSLFSAAFLLVKSTRERAEKAEMTAGL